MKLTSQHLRVMDWTPKEVADCILESVGGDYKMAYWMMLDLTVRAVNRGDTYSQDHFAAAGRYMIEELWYVPKSR